MKPLDPFSSFEAEYWKKTYSEPETMDGIFNAREHIRYLQAFFNLYLIDINSVADFGVGLGALFKMALKQFLPHRALGLEPSHLAFKQLQKKFRPPVSSIQLKFLQLDLATWARQQPDDKKRPWDLGLCTSVFQYIPDHHLKIILPVMARRVKYLYLTVPTDVEAQRMKEETDFIDPYALVRTREHYLQLISPHFTILGKSILESKVHFDQHTTAVNELLFRF